MVIKKGKSLEFHQTYVKQQEKGSADYKCNYKESKKRLHISSLNYPRNQTKNASIAINTDTNNAGPAQPVFDPAFSSISFTSISVFIDKLLLDNVKSIRYPAPMFRKEKISDAVIFLGLAVNVLVIVAIIAFYVSR